MQRLFSTTKEEFKDDHLFEENDEIKIRENSFVQILTKLENFNLSDTQDDVKGIAFEQFLGTTFRGELGQFFTPRTIVDFMTEILDPQEGEIICDPTCGSGGFLIKAFEYVREKIEADIRKHKDQLRADMESVDYESKSEEEQIKISQSIDEMQLALNTELDTSVRGSRMYQLSRNCIYGTDANPRMARTSKMNMIMHGDGHGGVHHHDGLLNVNGIFEERFDVILTNPPFGQNVDRNQIISAADKFTDEDMKKKYRTLYGKAYDEALRQVDDHLGKSLLSLYDLGSASTLTEVLFMERCLKLLKKGGRMGMVLPEGVLNNKNLQAVREYFEGKAKLILICSIPQDVFIAAGATVKPSLVFMRKFTEAEEKTYAECKQKAIDKVTAVHQTELDALNSTIEMCESLVNSLKDDLMDAKNQLKKAKKAKQDTSAIETEITEIRQKQKNNKDNKKIAEKELAELQKHIAEEIKPVIKKYFDYETDLEDLGVQIDELQRRKFSKDETDAIYVARYCEESMNAVNRKRILKADKAKLEDELKEMKKAYKENEKEIAAADFDIFGGAYQDKTKMQTIRNTQHRETPKNRFQILNIRPDTEFEFYKDRLRDFVNLLHESFQKITLPVDLSVYLLAPDEEEPKGIHVCFLNPQDAINMCKNKGETCKLYRINLKEKMPVIFYSNIIFFDNTNNTLPVGMDLSTEMLVDFDKFDFFEQEQKEVGYSYENDKKELVFAKLHITEYEADEKR